MSYLEAIKIALCFFPFLALLFVIPFILWQYHKYGSINKFRVLIIYSFILYIICVYFLAIFPLPGENNIEMNFPMCQLIPFSFILDIIKDIKNAKNIWMVLNMPSVYTVLFNILMFMPLGMYLRYYFKSDLKKTIIVSLMFSLFLEVTQLTGLYFIYPHPYRLFDVDDLLINTIGGGLGYFVVGILMRYLPSRDNIDFKSLEDGKEVSGLRRITRFGLDIFLWFILSVVLSVIFDFKLYYVSLIIYYVIIPFLCNGQTLGSRFLNMKLDLPNNRLFGLLLRLILVLLYYIFIPFGIGLIFVFYFKNFDIPNVLVFVIGVIYVLLLGIFYLVNMTSIFKRKSLIYDRLSGCMYVSTIGEKLQKSNEM